MGRVPKPKVVKDKDGEIQLLSPDDAKRTVAYVNRGRMFMAQRLNTLRLWDVNDSNIDHPTVIATKPNRSDHPLIQVILALRDELSDLPAHSPDQKVKQNRVTILRAIADLIQSATAEAHKSSTEIQAMLARAEDFQQRKKEHADKMQALAMRAGGGMEPTDAELEAAALLEAPDEVAP